MPQNPLQGYDSHFTLQAQRLKVETTQHSYCNCKFTNYQIPVQSSKINKFYDPQFSTLKTNTSTRVLLSK